MKLASYGVGLLVVAGLAFAPACKKKDDDNKKKKPAGKVQPKGKTPKPKTDKPKPAAKKNTEQVLDAHLAAFGKRDMKAILADYADNAVLITPMGTMKGKAAIGKLFTGLFAEFAKPGMKFKMGKKMVKDEVAFITWSAETADNSYEMATDTLVVKDGKILAQTFAGVIKPKAKKDAPKAGENKAETKDVKKEKAPEPAKGSTAAVLASHLGAFGKKDMKAILADYTDKAVMLSPMGELVGPKALEGLFKQLFAEFGKKGVKFKLHHTTIEGEIAFIVWSADTPDNTYELATDTFVVRGGKIAYQTFAGKITPKKK